MTCLQLVLHWSVFVLELMRYLAQAVLQMALHYAEVTFQQKKLVMQVPVELSHQPGSAVWQMVHFKH